VSKTRKVIDTWAGRKHGIVVAVLLLCSTTSFGGREPEEWDDLPQFDSISFSQPSVGFTTPEGEHYILDRATSRIQEVTGDLFAQEFAGAIGIKAAEVTELGAESTVTLKTSGGKELTTKNAYCDEGRSEHTLSMNGSLVKDHVQPCTSVSCAEIVGNQLWLGTRYDGELGDLPAEGIVVQSLDKGQLVKSLGTKQGLTGDLIRAIRFDPVDKTIWVTTNEGINEVDPDFRVRRTLFSYQELDPDTGIPKVSLSLTKQKGNPLATVFKELHVLDAKKFYDATRSIPADIRERFMNERNSSNYRPVNATSLEEAFAPKEMNALVPFFIEAARSSDHEVRELALFNICAFNDLRIVDFLIEETSVPARQQRSDARECLDKFLHFGLVSAQQKDNPIALMPRQESQALGRIRGSRECRRGDYDIIATSAKSLKRAGDLRGMDLINEYFKASDFNPGDACFYAAVGKSLDSEDEIAPAMVEGLEKIIEPAVVIEEVESGAWKGGYVLPGCGFFDMRVHPESRRFDARYAQAILIAIERQGGIAAERRSEGHMSNPYHWCVEAFRSQLRNTDVHAAFFNDVYPKLTPQQQALADELSKDPLATGQH